MPANPATPADTLTLEEKMAIALLEKAARHWPESLWLFSASGSLLVMKKKDGERVMLPGLGGAIDQSWEIACIDIENDGGDF